MRTLLMFVGVMILARCELIVDVDVPYEGDKVVVNSVPDTNSPWRVNLSRSSYILASESEFYHKVIDEATITIFDSEGPEQIQLVSDNMGTFTAPSHPQPGKRYKIVVEPKENDPVEAEMTMPELIPIIDVKWDSANMKDRRSYIDINFKVTFDDPASIKNYYQVMVYTYLLDSTDTVQIRSSLYITDPAVGTEDDHISIFKDVTFDGQRYEAPFNCQLRLMPVGPWGQVDRDPKLVRVELWLLSLSEEYFLYQDSQKLQEQVKGDPFAQPVPVYSNLSNGFGIFAGTATDVRSWKRIPTVDPGE